MSGGQAGAENGPLTVMCGGDAAPFERAKPVADAFSKAVTLIGPSGAGQVTKMMNQMCIAGIVQGLAEALNSASAPGSTWRRRWAPLQGRGAELADGESLQNMVNGKFDYGFAVDWMRKDLGIALAEGKRQKAAMPLVALVDQFYERVQARGGGGRWDTSSLIQPLQKP